MRNQSFWVPGYSTLSLCKIEMQNPHTELGNQGTLQINYLLSTCDRNSDRNVVSGSFPGLTVLIERTFNFSHLETDFAVSSLIPVFIVIK